MLKLKIKSEQEAEETDYKTLERWKMSCMMSMAAGEGFPAVNIEGIEDISSDSHYY